MANRAQSFNARALYHLGVPPLETGLDGRGVAIGFVDYGFDILHPCFRDLASGRSRFRYLWDQNTGREFDGDEIDRLITIAEDRQSREPVDKVYDPHANYFGRAGVGQGAHGTFIASAAAGSAIAGFRGVAPAAELIAVQVGLLDHHWKEEDERGTPTWISWRPEAEPTWSGWRNYDEAEQISSALEYIYDRARRIRARGLVINLSIGAYAGAHDGKSPVEQKISQVLARARFDRFPCAVVISAGNAGLEEGHFSGVVEPGQPLSFAWRMFRTDLTQNKLEIWYRAKAPILIGLELHGTPLSQTISPGQTHSIKLGDVRIGIADHVPNARDPLSRARILLHPPFFPKSAWPNDSDEVVFTVRCAATETSGVAVLHAWLERDDGPGNRSTLYPSHPTSTLSCLSGAPGAIVVGAYDHLRKEAVAPFPFASLGPLPWSNFRAPLVTAPGHRIWGARSKSSGFAESSGTSVAAALTSGLVALQMQQIPAEQPYDQEHWAQCLCPPDRRTMWDPRFGYGPITLRHSMEKVAA